MEQNRTARVTPMATALVTGATAGIGAAFAHHLAGRGDDLVLVARDGVRLDKLAAELTDRHHVKVEIMAADLAVRADVAAVAARLEDPDRPVDILINNAGFGVTAKLLEVDTSEHEQAIQVMGIAPLMLGAAAGRAMKSRGHGSILNVASLSAFIAQGGYSPVKAYAKVWSEGLAGELHGTGVAVTALCPGWVRTEFHSRASIKTSGIPSFIWVDADRVARESLQHLDDGKVISIPTKRWKLAAFALQYLPRPMIRWISRSLTKSRD